MSSYSDLILGHAALRAYYRLGEASGTVMDDAGSNNLDGTYNTGTTLGVAGLLTNDSNTAVTFDGTSAGYATVLDANPLDLGNGPLSIELWVKRSATQSAIQPLIAKGAGAYQVRFQTANTIAFLKNGTGAIVASTSTVTDTNRHHVVVTWDGTTGKVYIDGADVSGATTVRALTDTTTAFVIGASPTQFQPGTMDEVALYGTVLTPAEVLEHYTAGTTLPAPPPSGGGWVWTPPLRRRIVVEIKSAVEVDDALALSYEKRYPEEEELLMLLASI